MKALRNRSHSAVLVQCLTMCVCLALWASSAMGADETKTIYVDVDPGTSEENNVGCGYMLVEKNDTDLIINLTSSGTIAESQLVSSAPNQNWTKISETQWKLTGVAPNEKFWCVIKAKVVKGGGQGGGQGAGGGDPWRWMSVSDVDLDADTDNDSQAAHRPPSESDDEDLEEYPTGPTDNVIGLIVPLNDNNDVSWDYRDSKKSMDRAADPDIMDMKLKIDAKKAGAFVMYCDGAATLYRYDDAGVADGDEGFDDQVAAGSFSKSIHVEPPLVPESVKGDVGHVNVSFHPNAPTAGSDSRDKLRFVLVGVDIDVDSDSSGGANPIEETNSWNSDEDFYENHPASELTLHPEFKNGMLVAVNDDSDDDDTDADNGWNDTDWSGPESEIVVTGENDLKPMALRALQLGDDDDDPRRAGMNVLEPRIAIKQVGGSGAIRIFTTGANPQVVWDNSSTGFQDRLPDNTLFWDALKGNDDLSLQIEGLTAGEVILEVSLRLQHDVGPDIHRDIVRISVQSLVIVEAGDYIVPKSDRNLVSYTWGDDDAPDSIEMKVYDKDDTCVRTIADLPVEYPEGESAVEYTWDGCNDQGAALVEAASPYTIKLLATWDGQSTPMAVTDRRVKVKEWRFSFTIWDKEGSEGSGRSGIDLGTITEDKCTPTVQVVGGDEIAVTKWAAVQIRDDGTPDEYGKNAKVTFKVGDGADDWLIFYTTPSFPPDHDYCIYYDVTTEVVAEGAKDKAANEWDMDKDTAGVQRKHSQSIAISPTGAITEVEVGP